MAEAADFQGTSPSPARRWLRRTGAVLAGAPLLAGVLQLPTSSSSYAAEPSAAAEATGSRTVDVSLDSLSPSVPSDGDTLTVSGRIVNKGKQAVTAAHVGLRVGPTLNGRSAIDDAAKSNPYAGSEVGGKYVAEFERLAPGVPQTFSISVPVDKLDLGSDGVYQLGVTLTGRTTAAAYDQILGIERTFLPWQEDAADSKTRTTYLWPLISTSHMTAETGSNEQQTPVFADDDALAAELSPGGRLEQLLSLGKDLDITWVIDPDLLASVDAMTRSYRVQVNGSSQTTTAGTHQAVAKQWLSKLEKAVEGEEVVALPFADPDLASLAHHGTKVTGSLSHLKDATTAAAITVEAVLHVTPSTEYAWPVSGAIDPSIVKVATSAGADTVLARSDSLQETGALPYTPSAARPIGGGTTAVVADARLSTAFQGDMTVAGNSTLAVQRFLAQSLMLNRQAPDKQRTAVVAPQRMPTASQAQTMAQALTALQGGNWSESAELAAATKAKPDAGATTRVPSASAYPRSLAKQELPEEAFARIEETQRKLNSFQVVLSDKSRVVTPFGRAMDRSMSTSWRGRADEAEAYREGVLNYLIGLTEGVGLIDKSEAKLSGRSATIPVTVQNNLVQGVDHLVLRLTSTQPSRLSIGDGAFQEQPVAVAGGHSQSVKFTTNAHANGRAGVIAQLYTEDGQAYGPAVAFDVKVTEITATVMLVIAGGVLLLVLAGFRMYTQRKREAARQAALEKDAVPTDDPAESASATDAESTDAKNADTESADGTEGGHDRASTTGSSAPDPEHPSDPSPDTAPEITDPSGTGERVDR
ncbi:hypothetical protein J8N05_06175 [Streptomyces sp. BH-SS-21]|uniref:Uncharacterized protein n=1 Tax=Streptomyces liliiviolaceus TaxID=2823109 RepID=A0A940XPE5_9ACTN|nr:DUF6049 family protein [Streptomyces liliiviolaceus]MBQ0847801.1 hypothetical protein [Streptomyces liliiviolaceus]